MSVFRGNRHNEVWMDSDKTVAKGTSEDNPHAFPSGDASDPNRPPKVQPVAQHWSVAMEGNEQDEIRTAPLTPIPEPGFAAFPEFLSLSNKGETVLMMKPNWKNKGFDVTDITDGSSPGQAMFTIENPSPKLKPKSSKRVFSDTNTGAKLCLFERETMLKLQSVYRANDPSTKRQLAEVRVKKSSSEITATLTSPNSSIRSGGGFSFSNEIDDGSAAKDKQTESEPTLEWKGHATELRGTIEYQGQLVATIEKKFLVTSTEYHLRIAQGLDPFLVVVLAQAIDDRRHTSDSMVPFGAFGSGAIA